MLQSDQGIFSVSKSEPPGGEINSSEVLAVSLYSPLHGMTCVAAFFNANFRPTMPTPDPGGKRFPQTLREADAFRPVGPVIG
jgi:hypothetical protein